MYDYLDTRQTSLENAKCVCYAIITNECLIGVMNVSIEEVLDLYRSMTPEQQIKFIQEGEKLLADYLDRERCGESGKTGND